MNTLKLTIVFIGSASIFLSIINLIRSRRKSTKVVWIANIIIGLLCISLAVYGLLGGM